MPIRILDFVDGFESASAPTSVSFPASSVSVTPVGALVATNAQTAFQELDSDLTAHVTDSTDAHAGSAITNTPSGNLAATTVQGAVNELQGDVDTINNKIGAPSGIASLDSGGRVPVAQIPLIALVDVNVVADITARDALTVQEGDVAVVTDAGSGVTKSYIYNGSSWTELITDGSLFAHLSDTSGAHAASAISNTTSGNLTSTNVQASLQELQGDIDTINSNATEVAQDAVGAMVDSTLIYTDGTPLLSRAALTGDVTASSGSNATTIPNDTVTNAKSANMAESTIKGRAAGAGTGDPTDLTATQATAILNAVVGDSGSGGTKGLAPAPGSGDAAAGKFLHADGTYQVPPSSTDQSYEISNLGLASSVGSNAITFALKIKDGSTNASAGSPVKIGFRSSTLATGAYNQRSVTGALSFVLSSGSTGGHASGVAGYHYIYALDNAGTVELARCGILLDEDILQTTVAEGGAGAADSLHVLYSTTQRTDVPVRLIGRVRATQATAGTHATAPSEVTVLPFITDVKPFLAVTGIAPQVNANINIVLPTVDTDTHSCYSTSTGAYTTKRTGWYRVTYSIANPMAVGNIVYASVQSSAYGVFSGTGLGWSYVTGQPSGGSGLVKITTVGWTIALRATANQSGGGNTQDTMTIEWVRDI